MKTAGRTIVSGLCAVAWLWWAPAAWSVTLPYDDTFSVPPYVNNTTIVGQQGWINNGGQANGAVITNEWTQTNAIHATSNAFGTALFIDNSQTGKVYQAIAAPFCTNGMRVKFNIYGTLASNPYAMLSVYMEDDSGRDAVDLQCFSAFAASPRTSRFVLNNNLGVNIVTNITCSDKRWYAVTIDVSWTGKTYSVQITDGVTTGIYSDVPFWYDALSLPVGKLSRLRFVPPSSGAFPNNSAYIDNLSIMRWPPPKGTVMLLK
jgi:hypothetical protein